MKRLFGRNNGGEKPEDNRIGAMPVPRESVASASADSNHDAPSADQRFLAELAVILSEEDEAKKKEEEEEKREQQHVKQSETEVTDVVVDSLDNGIEDSAPRETANEDCDADQQGPLQNKTLPPFSDPDGHDSNTHTEAVEASSLKVNERGGADDENPTLDENFGLSSTASQSLAKPVSSASTAPTNQMLATLETPNNDQSNGYIDVSETHVAPQIVHEEASELENAAATPPDAKNSPLSPSLEASGPIQTLVESVNSPTELQSASESEKNEEADATKAETATDMMDGPLHGEAKSPQSAELGNFSIGSAISTPALEAGDAERIMTFDCKTMSPEAVVGDSNHVAVEKGGDNTWFEPEVSADKVFADEGGYVVGEMKNENKPLHSDKLGDSTQSELQQENLIKDAGIKYDSPTQHTATPTLKEGLLQPLHCSDLKEANQQLDPDKVGDNSQPKLQQENSMDGQFDKHEKLPTPTHEKIPQGVADLFYGYSDADLGESQLRSLDHLIEHSDDTLQSSPGALEQHTVQLNRSVADEELTGGVILKSEKVAGTIVEEVSVERRWQENTRGGDPTETSTRRKKQDEAIVTSKDQVSGAISTEKNIDNPVAEDPQKQPPIVPVDAQVDAQSKSFAKSCESAIAANPPQSTLVKKSEDPGTIESVKYAGYVESASIVDPMPDRKLCFICGENKKDMFSKSMWKKPKDFPSRICEVCKERSTNDATEANAGGLLPRTDEDSHNFGGAAAANLPIIQVDISGTINTRSDDQYQVAAPETDQTAVDKVVSSGSPRFVCSKDQSSFDETESSEKDGLQGSTAFAGTVVVDGNAGSAIVQTGGNTSHYLNTPNDGAQVGNDDVEACVMETELTKSDAQLAPDRGSIAVEIISVDSGREIESAESVADDGFQHENTIAAHELEAGATELPCSTINEETGVFEKEELSNNNMVTEYGMDLQASTLICFESHPRNMLDNNRKEPYDSSAEKELPEAQLDERIWEANVPGDELKSNHVEKIVMDLAGDSDMVASLDRQATCESTSKIKEKSECISDKSELKLDKVQAHDTLLSNEKSPEASDTQSEAAHKGVTSCKNEPEANVGAFADPTVFYGPQSDEETFIGIEKSEASDEDPIGSREQKAYADVECSDDVAEVGTSNPRSQCTAKNRIGAFTFSSFEIPENLRQDFADSKFGEVKVSLQRFLTSATSAATTLSEVTKPALISTTTAAKEISAPTIAAASTIASISAAAVPGILDDFRREYTKQRMERDLVASFIQDGSRTAGKILAIASADTAQSTPGISPGHSLTSGCEVEQYREEVCRFLDDSKHHDRNCLNTQVFFPNPTESHETNNSSIHDPVLRAAVAGAESRKRRYNRKQKLRAVPRTFWGQDEVPLFMDKFTKITSSTAVAIVSLSRPVWEEARELAAAVRPEIDTTSQEEEILVVGESTNIGAPLKAVRGQRIYNAVGVSFEKLPCVSAEMSDKNLARLIDSRQTPTEPTRPSIKHDQNSKDASQNPKHFMELIAKKLRDHAALEGWVDSRSESNFDRLDSVFAHERRVSRSSSISSPCSAGMLSLASDSDDESESSIDITLSTTAGSPMKTPRPQQPADLWDMINESKAETVEFFDKDAALLSEADAPVSAVSFDLNSKISDAEGAASSQDKSDRDGAHGNGDEKPMKTHLEQSEESERTRELKFLADKTATVAEEDGETPKTPVPLKERSPVLRSVLSADKASDEMDMSLSGYISLPTSQFHDNGSVHVDLRHPRHRIISPQDPAANTSFSGSRRGSLHSTRKAPSRRRLYFTHKHSSSRRLLKEDSENLMPSHMRTIESEEMQLTGIRHSMSENNLQRVLSMPDDASDPSTSLRLQDSVADLDDLTAEDAGGIFDLAMMTISSIALSTVLDDIDYPAASDPLKYLASVRWRQLVSNWTHLTLAKAMMERPFSLHYRQGVENQDPADENVLTTSTGFVKSTGRTLDFLDFHHVRGTIHVETRNLNGLAPHLADGEMVILTSFIAEFGSTRCIGDSSEIGNKVKLASILCDKGSKVTAGQLADVASSELKNFAAFVEDIVQFSAHNFDSSCELTVPEVSYSVGIKSQESIEKKAKKKYKGDLLQVKDVLRAQVTFGDEGSLVAGLLQLVKMCSLKKGIDKNTKQIEIVRVKNLFQKDSSGTICSSPLPTGYRHILVNVRIGGQLLAEIQFQIAEMFQVLGYDGYELHREIGEVDEACAASFLAEKEAAPLATRKSKNSQNFVFAAGGGRGGLMAAIAGRGAGPGHGDAGGRGGLIAAIAGRGVGRGAGRGGRGDAGGRGGLMAAIAERGAGSSDQGNAGGRDDAESVDKAGVGGGGRGGRGDLLAAIAGRGHKPAAGGDGRGDLLAAFCGRGRGSALVSDMGDRKDLMAASSKRGSKPTGEGGRGNLLAAIGGRGSDSAPSTGGRSGLLAEISSQGRGSSNGGDYGLIDASTNRYNTKEAASQSADKDDTVANENEPAKEAVIDAATEVSSSDASVIFRFDKSGSGVGSIRIAEGTHREELLAKLKDTAGSITEDQVLLAMRAHGTRELSSSPRDVATLYCLHAISIIQAGAPIQPEFAGLSSLFSLRSKDEARKYQKRSGSTKHGDERKTNLIVSKECLLRCLAISNQGTAVGMIGWVEYGAENFSRIFDGPMLILRDLAYTFACLGERKKTIDSLQSLTTKCDQHLPVYHPMTLCAMLDLAGAARLASCLTLQQTTMKDFAIRLAFYLSEQEQCFFSKLSAVSGCEKSQEKTVIQVDDNTAGITMLKAFTEAFENQLSETLLKRVCGCSKNVANEILLAGHCYLADSLMVLANCILTAESLFGGTSLKKRTSRFYWKKAYKHYEVAFKGLTQQKKKLSNSAVLSASYGMARCLREIGQREQALQILSSAVTALGRQANMTFENEDVADRSGISLSMLPRSHAAARRSFLSKTSSYNREYSLALFLWLMAVISVESVPCRERGRMRALSLLHAASETLRGFIAAQHTTEPGEDDLLHIKTCSDLLRRIEEEAKVLLEPIKNAFAEASSQKAPKGSGRTTASSDVVAV